MPWDTIMPGEDEVTIGGIYLGIEPLYRDWKLLTWNGTPLLSTRFEEMFCCESIIPTSSL